MKRYNSYKESGAKWLGEFPSHWTLVKNKFVAKLYNGNSLNEKAKDEFTLEVNEEHLPYISSKDIDLNTETVNYFNGLAIPIKRKEFKIAPSNSFLLCIEGGSAGRKRAFIERDVCFVNKLCCFKSIINPKYHYYWISSLYFRCNFQREMQGLIGGVSVKTLMNFYVARPSEQEQNAIVTYLDLAISKIDEAIAQQQKMIDLLNERKQIIINKTVTKGLDSNVKMKPSGVDWIGDIPEHWEMRRLKTILYVKDKRNSDPNAVLLSVFTSIGVKPRKELEEKGNKASTVINYKIVNKGDLIVNRLLAWMGAYGLSNYEGVTSPDYDVYSFRNGYCRNYYEIYFRNTQFKSDCYKYGHGIMMMRWRTYSDEFLNIVVPVPPIEEQERIFKNLEPHINKTNMAIEKCYSMISLLQERKQIIINDVVTGKVKVV
jgi:type I restriction enzyme S subunit